MASEALYIPEEHLEKVIEIIRNGMKYTYHVPRAVKSNLKAWCDSEEAYLNELKEEEE